MSALGERTLFGLLDDTESVQYLAQQGLDLATVPTEQLRPVVTWSLTHYRLTGKAPTRPMLVEQFGDLLSDHEMADAYDVEETIEWAVDDLYSSYVRNVSGDFNRRMATEITTALPDERLDVLGKFVSEIAGIHMRLQPRTAQVDLTQTGDDILAQYEQAVATRGEVRGLAFGLAPVDQMTGGVRDGELCVIAGGAKTGKSWFVDHIALREWQRGQETGRVPGLFTLENSIEMTQLRLACIALGLSQTELQNGSLSEPDHQRLREWVNDVLLKSEVPFPIFNPDTTSATPQAVVQAARAYGVDSLIIDQLSHMENGKARGKDQARTYEIRDIMRDLKGMISSGRHQMSCVLAHQINRDGMKHADKHGRLEMWHLADSSDVERTADMVFGLYASEDMRLTHRMQLQTLAARRFPPNDFDLMWQIDIGRIGVINQVAML